MRVKIKGRTVTEHEGILGRNHTQKARLSGNFIRMDVGRMTERVWATTYKTRRKTKTKLVVGFRKEQPEIEINLEGKKTVEITTYQRVCSLFRNSTTEKGTETE